MDLRLPGELLQVKIDSPGLDGCSVWSDIRQHPLSNDCSLCMHPPCWMLEEIQWGSQCQFTFPNHSCIYDNGVQSMSGVGMNTRGTSSHPISMIITSGKSSSLGAWGSCMKSPNHVILTPCSNVPKNVPTIARNNWTVCTDHRVWSVPLHYAADQKLSLSYCCVCTIMYFHRVMLLIMLIAPVQLSSCC